MYKVVQSRVHAVNNDGHPDTWTWKWSLVIEDSKGHRVNVSDDFVYDNLGSCRVVMGEVIKMFNEGGDVHPGLHPMPQEIVDIGIGPAEDLEPTK